MSITPLKFTGISAFSEDFHTILSRAAQIASLPVQALQNDQTELLARKTSLSSLRSTVADLALSLEAIGNIGANRALSVSSTNTSRVTVTNNGITASGVFTVSEITSIARAASENFVTGLDTADADQVDSDGVLQLVFGTATHQISLTSEANNLTGLRNAINELGAGVTASIINSGGATGAYYLSIAAQATGEISLQLNTATDGSGANLLTNVNQGANANFKLNGIAITRADNVVAGAIEGLTLNLLNETEPGETVQITATSARGQLASSFSDFATAYNRAVDAINAHTGEAAGILSGDNTLRELQNTLRTITGYAPNSGSLRSLAAIGLELDKSGKMSFNSAKFYALSTAGFESALDFVATAEFRNFGKRIDQISNPVTGLIKTQQNTIDAADARIDDQIAALQERIQVSQASLSLKLQQADVLISQFTAQQNQLSAVIKSLNTATFGKEKE